MSSPRWSLHFAWGRAPYDLDLPEVVVGRGDSCTLQITEPEAADEHARFIVDEEEHVWLEDLGRGTLLNGKSIEKRTRVEDGDFVQIGRSVITLRSRAAAAKNVVVSDEQPDALATLMMESPLAHREHATLIQDPIRESQRTVEVDAGEILAALRRSAAPPMTVPEPAVRPSDRATKQVPTLMGVSRLDAGEAKTQLGDLPVHDPETSLHPAERSTFLDVLPSPRGATPKTSPNTPELSTFESVLPTRIDAPAVVSAAHSTFESVLPKPRANEPRTPSPNPAHSTFESVLPTHVDSVDMVSAPTQIAQTPRPRSQTNTDITPLPAPLPPPMMSIPDLRSLSRSPMDNFDDRPGERTRSEKRGPSAQAVHDAQTQQLSSVKDEQALGLQATQLPTPVPQEVANITAQNAAPQVTRSSAPHRIPDVFVPPPKGAFGSFSRAIDFFHQMFALARQDRTIVKPILYDLMLSTPVSLAIALLLLVIRSPNGVYLVLAIGTAALYFMDYSCNALTASLMFDYATTGTADMKAARERVTHSMKGILVFASVSALLDVASTYARERHDVLSKVLLRILRAIWTTATYVIMPAMVIEGASFKDALSRSKKLMDQDPTGVGAGVVALSLCSYICALIFFPLAFFLMRLGAHVHPIFGAVLFFATVNAYWSVSGWLKIAYSTCFYLWAKRCEEAGHADESLAPLPLRHALAAG